MFGRLPELIEGVDGKFSQTKICTYMVVITLCAVLLDADSDDKASIALIAAGLALGQVGINKTAEVKIAQVQTPINPQNITINQPEVSNVSP